MESRANLLIASLTPNISKTCASSKGMKSRLFTLQLILIQKQSCRNDFSEVYSLFIRLIFVVTISLTCIVKGFIWADLMTRNKVDNTEWFMLYRIRCNHSVEK